MTKRYILFLWDNFYPLGGMKDYKTECDDLEALMRLKSQVGYCQCAHIYDCKEQRIIMECSNQNNEPFDWEMVDEE